MRKIKNILKSVASLFVAASIGITLLAPNSLVSLAAEDNLIDLGTDYNSGVFSSYDEAVAESDDVREENIANDVAEGYINDSGELVYEPKYNDVNLAIDFVRQCMVERRYKIVFQLKTSANTVDLYRKEINNIIESAFDETPNGYEGDYLRWHWSACQKYAYQYKDNYVKYYIFADYMSSKEQEVKVTNKIEFMKNNTFKDWTTRSDYYNTERVFKWVCDNLMYDESRSSYSAYGGLVNGMAVCQGYSSTMYRLLKEIGVTNRIVSSENHNWNIVKLGDYYYNVDATWGDLKTKGKYDNSFFLVTDKNICCKDGSKANHIRTRINNFDYTSASFYKEYPMASTNYKLKGTEDNKTKYPDVGISYRTHIQDYGWERNMISNGATSGTVGQSKRLEAIVIGLNNKDSLDLGIEYKTHIQDYGWESSWRKEGTVSGTVGLAKRLEAIRIRLTGADAAMYDIYYRVHAQDYGWLGWARNGESAGTAGQSKRLEAIQIKIVKKGVALPTGTMGYSFVDYAKTAEENDANTGLINYKAHVQNYGWQNYVCDGSLSGTYGESKRLEAITIQLGATGYAGSVQYRTHIESIGWQSWRENGALSGTSGQSKRLEAIEIILVGDISKIYDVYYRVHAQDYGWLGWAKNGEPAGTEGLSKRLEGIQIVLVKKGAGAPSASAKRTFIK